MSLLKNKSLLVLLLTLPAVWALLRPGYWPSHDVSDQLLKTVEFSKMFEAGDQFPVRWSANAHFSLGSPIFNFYSPLFYYLAAILHKIGFSYFLAIKGVVAAIFFLGALGMFFLCREIWRNDGGGGTEGEGREKGEWAGVIGAVAYTYIPYRFVDVYVRGAYPEFLALALFPWVFWSFLKLSLLGEESAIWRMSLAGVFLAALLTAHNFVGLFFIPFFLAYLAFLERKNWRWKVWLRVGLGLALGLGLSAFFWLPAFWEQGYLYQVHLTSVNWRDHFVTFGQLLNSPWGYGSSLPGTANDGMSFQIGKIQLFLSLFVMLFVSRKVSQPKKNHLYFLLMASAFFIFLTLPYSSFLWQRVPFLQFGQFPWRFLGFTAFTLSIMASGIVELWAKERLFLWTLIIIFVLLGVRMARPSVFLLSANDRSLEGSTSTVSWMPGFVPRQAQGLPKTRPASKLEAEGEIRQKENLPTKQIFTVNSDRRQVLRLNIYYFPGWRVWIDNRRTEIEVDESGAMNFEIPQGQHEIKAVFSQTFLRMAADLLSLFTALFLFGWGGWVIYNRGNFGWLKNLLGKK